MVTRRPDLPAGVRVLQAGLVINAFGNGAAAPFLVLYLHDVRGIALPLAGAAAATSAGFALLATLTAGGLADRRGRGPRWSVGCAAPPSPTFSIHWYECRGTRWSWRRWPGPGSAPG